MNPRRGFSGHFCAGIAMLALLSACGGGDDDSPAAPTPPPSSISYTSPQIFVVGTAANLAPTIVGSPSSYTVSPALPAGLSLSSTTGAISGTPTAVAAQATYTISATASAGGTLTFALSLTVNPAAPANLSYSDPLTFTAGTAIAPASPTVTGVVTTYTVTPALPAGLTLNGTTGVISGAAGAATAQATYVVTATNVTGSTSFNLRITVNAPIQTATGTFIDAVVSGLGYVSGTHSGVTDANGNFTYEVGQPVTFSVGHVALGTVQGSERVTPLDLVPGSTGATPQVVNLVRFLMLMDSDGNPANGITISPALRERAAAWPQIDFAATDLDTALATIIPDTAVDGTVRALPAAAAAQTHFGASFRCAMSGYYRGTFAGDDHGNFAFTITPDGRLAGAAYSVVEEELIALQFQPRELAVQNDAALVAGLAGTGSSFTGKLTGYREVSGTWTDGTFSGARYAGGTTAAYKFLALLSYNGTVIGSALLEVDPEDAVTLTPHVNFMTNEGLPVATGPLSNNQFSQILPDGSVAVTIDKSALTLMGTWINTANGTTGPITGVGCRLR